MVTLSTQYGKNPAVRRKLRSSPTDSLKVKFKEMRANVKKVISISRANFFDSLEDNFLSNPKGFWSIFKLISKESRIPDTVSLGKDDGYSAKSQIRSASTPAFNDYFASVFNRTELEDRASVLLSSYVSNSRPRFLS